MPSSLSTFKSKLVGGGARPNLFEVTMTNIPGTGIDSDKMKYMCKAAQLPASNVASIDVPFRGRTLKVAGDRTFDTWTVTIINDTDFALRKAFEDWMQFVAQYQEASGATNPSDYLRDATVKQLGRLPSSVGEGEGNSKGQGLDDIATYEFKDIFPTNISAIDVSYDTTDTIEEFTVEFQVNYWYPVARGTSSGG